MRNATWGLVLLAFGASATSADIGPPGAVEANDPLEYSHLIVQGTVERIGKTTTTFAEWGFESLGASKELNLTTIDLVVEAVLKGSWNNERISFSLIGQRSRGFALGQKLIVGGHFNPVYLGGSYTVVDDGAIFRLDGDGWVRQSDRLMLTGDQIAQRIRSTSPEAIAGRATIAVLGRVTKVEGRPWISRDGRECPIVECTVRVERTFKGSPGESLTFSMMSKGGCYPPWRARVPSEMSPGERWYLLLGESEDGYYPVGGVNGMFELRGDKLLYDRQIELPVQRLELERMIERGGNQGD